MEIEILVQGLAALARRKELSTEDVMILASTIIALQQCRFRLCEKDSSKAADDEGQKAEERGIPRRQIEG